ncbi:MAG: LysM peptidoglycan-binding domain-containing protein [Flavobacteriales bacterium]|nr:LysM peptidoglycan-binding domain-containing protein [Flavobacteriales bacterium]
MKRVVLIVALTMPFLLQAQMQQVKVFAKYKGLVSDEENTQGFSYQSLDGAKSCEGKISVKYSGSTVESINVDLGDCGALMQNFGKSFEFRTPEKTDDTDDFYYFLENADASGRIRVSEGVFYLENLIPKTQSNKVRYRFFYNENELNRTNTTTSTTPSKPTNPESGKDESEKGTSEDETVENSQIENKTDQNTNVEESRDQNGTKTESPSNTKTGYFTYTLVEGDYIYKLAREYNCSPIELLRINGLDEGTVLYPGDQIQLCGSGAGYQAPVVNKDPGQTKTETQEFDEVKSLKVYGDEMKEEYENLVGTYNDLRKSYKALEKENFSLKTYGEEMKQEYELLVSEFDKVRASYNSLMEEYKELVTDYKRVKKENEELKKLVKQLQGGSPDDLTDEEKAKVAELQSKLGTFKDQLKDMREKLEEAKDEGDDLQFEMEDKKDEMDDMQDEKSESANDNAPKSSEEKDFSTNENMLDPEKNKNVLNNFCKGYEEKLVADPDVYGAILFAKNITLNLSSEGNISDLSVEGTDAIEKKDNVKRAEELLTGELIQEFEQLSLAGVGEKRTKLIVDVKKKSYQIKIKKNNLKFLSDNAEDMNGSHPHVKLILDKYKEEGAKPGTYRVNIFDGSFQLDEMSSDGSKKMEDLANYKTQYVSKFMAL